MTLSNKVVGNILGKPIRRDRKSRNNIGQTVEYPNDLIQAEFSNMTNDSNNPWKYKKGEQLHNWTDDTYWVIVKVNKYPDSGITIRRTK